MFKHSASLILILLCLTILTACSSPGLARGGISNNPGSGPTPALVNNLASQLIPVVAPTQTPAPLADTPEPVIILTFTPVLVAAAQNGTSQLVPSCTNHAELVKDLNLFNNVALDGGQVFAKLWRVKNTGTCVWTTAYALAFYSGEQMGGQPSIPLPSVVQPGETVDLRVDLVAPLNQTSYTGNWALQDASGNKFGVGDSGDQSISVTILVRPTPMPTTGCVHCDRLRDP
jgi:hypothetical protein